MKDRLNITYTRFAVKRVRLARTQDVEPGRLLQATEGADTSLVFPVLFVIGWKGRAVSAPSGANATTDRIDY